MKRAVLPPEKRARAAERGNTVIAQQQGGCFTCNGNHAIWNAKNTLAVAKRHFIATGHETWCESVYSTRYGGE